MWPIRGLSDRETARGKGLGSWGYKEDGSVREAVGEEEERSEGGGKRVKDKQTERKRDKSMR